MIDPTWQESLTEPIGLAGEFHCRLTPTERNEWFAFTRGLDHFEHLVVCGSQLERAKSTGTELDVRHAVRDYLGAVAAMHDVAAQWFEGVKARRAAAAAKPDGAA